MKTSINCRIKVNLLPQLEQFHCNQMLTWLSVPYLQSLEVHQRVQTSGPSNACVGPCRWSFHQNGHLYGGSSHVEVHSDGSLVDLP